MFLSVPAQGVLAQTSKDIGILVVDMQRIQRDSSAAISVREQTAAMRTNLEKTIAERAREISSEEAELAELRQRLTTDEFRARVRNFEEKVFANRDFAQRESSKLQSLLAQASTRLRREIAPILAQLLREREAQLMLDSSQVILNAETLDVTDEVIQRLDEAMPTMILAPVPAPE
jgi:outer membrane protein